MTEKKHVQVRIHGRVHGVGFRAGTQACARKLGLSGFVRNEADGTVYAEAEGPADAVEEFLAWCREGPPPARVDRVQAREGRGEGYEGFTIQA